MSDAKERALAKVSKLSAKIEGAELSLNEWKWARAEAMAEASDVGATQEEIGEAAGMNRDSARRHIRIWNAYGTYASKPSYSEAFDDVTGFDRDAAQERTDAARTKRTLREAPLEQVEQIISELPAERQQAIAAATGHDYASALQKRDEFKRNMTEAERQEVVGAQEAITQPARKVLDAIGVPLVVSLVQQATEELREMVSRQTLTAEQWKEVRGALSELYDEAQIAAAMVGLDLDLQEV